MKDILSNLNLEVPVIKEETKSIQEIKHSQPKRINSCPSLSTNFH
jgi:hypothetical protein